MKKKLTKFPTYCVSHDALFFLRAAAYLSLLSQSSDIDRISRQQASYINLN